MTYRFTGPAVAIVVVCAVIAPSRAQARPDVQIVSDRTSFLRRAHPVVIEDFTGTDHFPIPECILSSATDAPGIDLHPGDIEPGATYSTESCEGRAPFNIDAGGGFDGGFLDSVDPFHVFDRSLTIRFDYPIREFAFDTNDLMGPGFEIRFQLTDGSEIAHVFDDIPLTEQEPLAFFGFISPKRDISQIIIHAIPNTFSNFDFAVDNVMFSQPPRHLVDD